MVKNVIAFEDSTAIEHDISLNLKVIFECLREYNIKFPKAKVVCTRRLEKKYLASLEVFTLKDVWLFECIHMWDIKGYVVVSCDILQ